MVGDNRCRLRQIREATGLETVVLSGGVFMNALLTRETVERLERYGFRALSPSPGSAQRRRLEPRPTRYRSSLRADQLKGDD